MKHGNRFKAFQLVEPIPDAPPGFAWQYLMRMALQQARRAMEAGEVPVGAIIINSGGKIIGEAHNQIETLNDPTAHAEILGIRMAAHAKRNWRLNDCVLVTTLEPCVMCAGAIIHARLAGVVYGATDINAGAISSNLDCLDIACVSPVWHMGGVLAGECKNLLDSFFHGKRR